jgi:hypothetical protein
VFDTGKSMVALVEAIEDTSERIPSSSSCLLFLGEAFERDMVDIGKSMEDLVEALEDTSEYKPSSSCLLFGVSKPS